MTCIERYGWRHAVEPGIGRIVSAHGDYYRLVCNEADGAILARKKKSVFKFRKLADRNCRPDTRNAGSLQPVTGDFVRFRHNERGESLITDVLPRFSHFGRRDPTARRQSQTLAVNFDELFVMMSLNEDFSLPRVRRYLDLAADMGEAEAVVVVSKADLLRDGDEARLDELRREVGDAARVLLVSAIDGTGMDEVADSARPGRTLALVGSSGVGKSTLVNRLAGEDIRATQEVQEWSGRGRHTTTVRELVMLPSGAMILDTPGIREIGMVGEAELIQAKGESTHRRRK